MCLSIVYESRCSDRDSSGTKSCAKASSYEVLDPKAAAESFVSTEKELKVNQSRKRGKEEGKKQEEKGFKKKNSKKPMRLIKSPIRVYIVIWQEINFIFSILFYFLYLTIIIIFLGQKCPRL